MAGQMLTPRHVEGYLAAKDAERLAAERERDTQPSGQGGSAQPATKTDNK